MTDRYAIVAMLMRSVWIWMNRNVQGDAMRDKSEKLSVSEFAKLHDVNKRTLHYYDRVGLFEPDYKEDNRYRYYDCAQSIGFENIRMLRELNMGIDEIKEYLANPGADQFMQIADDKMRVLDLAERQIEKTRSILEKKKRQLEFCKTIRSGEIRFIEHDEEYLIATPFSSSGNRIPELMAHLKKVWGIEMYKAGCGSYISVDKVREKNFETYDGVYTPIHKRVEDANFRTLPGGRFICAYHIGAWQGLNSLYEDIMIFAEENKVQLVGNAYEMGLNEFAINKKEDYITQVLVRTKSMC